jgi:hypothetical protein
MWGFKALERTEISEERTASTIRVTRIGELETSLSVTSNRSTLVDSCYPDNEGAKFLRNIGSYKRNTALNLR